MASKRKACLVHSLPTAVLCLALLPDWQFKGSRADRMQGIGSNTAEKLEAPLYAKAMEDGYIHINAYGCTPLKWHRSDGACIPKNNGKEGPLANRVVHRLDEQGKGFFAGKMRARDKKKGAWKPCAAIQGFLKNMRREACVLTQLNGLWRLRRLKRSAAALNFDQVNAF